MLTSWCSSGQRGGRSRPWTWGLVGAVLVLVAGCGSETTPPESHIEEFKSEVPWDLQPEDGGEPLDQWVLDLPPDAGYLPDFGKACTGDGDCQSGYCVTTPGGKLCSTPCTTDCPSGWECLPLDGEPASTSICVPQFMDLCRPCMADADCHANPVQSGALCVPAGAAGSFCGDDCAADKSCPNGYGCQEVDDGAGGKAWQCVLAAGECKCQGWFAGAETQCFVENAFGTCVGARSCGTEADDGLSLCDAATAKQEECNALDDDCDQEVDEGLFAEPCEKVSEHGTCKGSVTCMMGEWKCGAQEPTAESCDGIDNDCNGDTDEGELDTDGDKTADCVDDNDDDDPLPDDQDNCPLVPNPDQENHDADPLGDACDDNDDDDELIDAEDNCPTVANNGQEDQDEDGLGDACDDDDDGDLDPDVTDCDPLNPMVANGLPEVCDGLDNNCNLQVDDGCPKSLFISVGAAGVAGAASGGNSLSFAVGQAVAGETSGNGGSASVGTCPMSTVDLGQWE
jgi:hypothetical protein